MAQDTALLASQRNPAFEKDRANFLKRAQSAINAIVAAFPGIEDPAVAEANDQLIRDPTLQRAGIG